ncbi:BppU family phage baseplate upper protein [Listeria booriae]|uniref:BppU family phage baseplate upper protein n=1 Tax=Listeria booriae TaxID=1552123 RepID=UPI001626D4A2|nr:BppU family phage baseplate upper protein [Listeria booriae]MBC2196804.1 BppU family phage baseplate upper protein [Listeria booriae]
MATLKNYPFSLDLVSDSLTPLILSRVTEKKSTTLVVEIFNNGDTIDDFDTYTPVFECALPGGKFVRDDGSTYGNMQKVEGKIVYTIAKEVFSTQGILNLCYFALEKGGTPGFQILDSLDLTADERVTTQNFTISVSKDATQGNIVVEDFISDIDKLTNFIEAETAQSMAALNIALTKLDVATASANELIALINANAVVKITDTTNWQKAKLTADSGAAKSPPDVTTLAAINEQGSFYINSTAAGKLTDAPGSGAFRLENHKLITGTAIEQHARYFSTSNASANRHFYRYVGATASPWREYENTVGSQAKADLAEAHAINSSIDFVNNKFADTGWIPLTLKAGFTAFANSVPRYRKIGNEVSYAGIVVRTSGGTGVFATIEDGYRQKDTYPQSHLVGQQTSAADAQAQIYTHSNGNLEIVSAVYASPIWLNEISYFTD